MRDHHPHPVIPHRAVMDDQVTVRVVVNGVEWKGESDHRPHPGKPLRVVLGDQVTMKGVMGGVGVRVKMEMECWVLELRVREMR